MAEWIAIGLIGWVVFFSAGFVAGAWWRASAPVDPSAPQHAHRGKR